MDMSKSPPLSPLEEARRKQKLKHFRSRTPHASMASGEAGITHKERMRRKRMEQDARKSGERFS